MFHTPFVGLRFRSFFKNPVDNRGRDKEHNNQVTGIQVGNKGKQDTYQ